MNKRIRLSFLAGIALFTAAFSTGAAASPERVVIIRHGEKPANGDNLSCQGENRALQLSKVLYEKFKKPDYTYVPSLGLGKSTSHSRMFQTVSPFAIKYNLVVNSKFGEKDFGGVAKNVMGKTGTVLLVWEHSAIPGLAKALGIPNPPGWDGKDFDSIWVITFAGGKASLSTTGKEGITPSADCSY